MFFNRANLKFQSAIILLLIVSLGYCNCSADLSELKPYLKKSLFWQCTTLNRDVPLNIYYPEDKTGPDGRDVIVYITNRAWERIGQESDISILSDFIKKRFIVITLDLGNDSKASSPFIDDDISEIYNAVFGYKRKSLLEDIGLVPKKYRCFVIPAGYRVATNLVYWEIDKHGVYGTLEHIMNSYNEQVVPNVPGLKKASTPADMVDREGKPFDFTVKMDILYPSQSKRKLPAFFFSETSQGRYAHIGPSSVGSRLNWNQLRGYVYVVMGHCFNPCTVHYWHFGGFTLDHWNGLACYTAAMRYLYAHSDKYSINTNYIGGMGISKGQYAITRLSDPNHSGGTESKKFESFPKGNPQPQFWPGQIVYVQTDVLAEGSPEPQPWPGYPSKIACGWQGMGMGLFESEYITPDYVPTILACGENDRDVITKDGYVRFLNRLEELNVNYIPLFMQGLGHSLTYGYDERLGVDRYQLVIDFFDRYLKVEDKLPPAVLLIAPRDGAENVSASSEICVYFAPVIDEKTILENDGIRLVSLSDNTPVKGGWKASHGGTKFTFVPEQALKNTEQYKIIISTKVRDKAGTYLDKEKTVRFKVASEEQGVVKDYDGNVYKTVKIGNQVWMAENLKVTHYRNGEPIPNIKEPKQWDVLTSGACCDLRNNPANTKAFGLIYNWYTIADVRNVCPAGWHVPSESEWAILVSFLAGEKITASSKTSGKIAPNAIKLNESMFKFKVLPQGFLGYDGEFSGLGYGGGGWWTSTSARQETAYYHGVNYNTASRNRLEGRKNFGYHIRCIKD